MSDESEVLATMVVTIAALRSRAEAAERHAEELAGALRLALDGLESVPVTLSGVDADRAAFVLRGISIGTDSARAALASYDSGRQMPGEGR